jgi:hypothetical protein
MHRNRLEPDAGCAAAPEGRLVSGADVAPAKVPPSCAEWIHENEHDGFRLMARRDAASENEGGHLMGGPCCFG